MKVTYVTLETNKKLKNKKVSLLRRMNKKKIKKKEIEKRGNKKLNSRKLMMNLNRWCFSQYRLQLLGKLGMIYQKTC